VEEVVGVRLSAKLKYIVRQSMSSTSFATTAAPTSAIRSPRMVSAVSMISIASTRGTMR
jgi:hypothetical protein